MYATLTKKGSIKVEIKIEKDKNYRTAEENNVEGEPIGVIPLDTIFSPVKLVSFKVEKYQSGADDKF